MDKNIYSLVLASQSPRRQELLKTLYVPFEIQPADLEEVSSQTDPRLLVEDLAFQKARAVAKDLSLNDVVLGSDTIVVLDNKVLGKPTSREHAREMLRSLSGRAHEVYTGVSIVAGSKNKNFSVETKVFFREISPELMELYLDTKESMDKAGAYGIQSYALSFIERIEGSYSNVVGLPVDHLLVELQNFMQEYSGEKRVWRNYFV